MRYITAFAALVAGAALVSAAPTCASRQYLDTATGLCQRCPSDALTCSSATVALSCQRGSFLTANKDCVTGNKCPPKTFADGATRTCKKCYSSNALTCSNAGELSATSCDSGTCLSAGKCLYVNRLLPGNYCAAGVVTRCSGGDGVSRCDSGGVPTSCKPGYNLAGSKATCVKCNGLEQYNPFSEECYCPTGTYKTDVVGCARCTDFGSLVDACTDTGPTHCMPGARLYQGQCLAECPAGTRPNENTCQDCSEFIGTTCDVAKAESCGLLVDEPTGTCTDTCRQVLGTQELAPTWQDGSVCRTCVGTAADQCSDTGRITACKAPYALHYTPDNVPECLLLSDCLALDPLMYGYYFGSDVGPYQRGFCWQCAPWAPPNEDRTRCMTGRA